MVTRVVTFSLLVLAVGALPAPGDTPDDELTVSAVQFEIDEQTATDRSALAEDISDSVEEAADSGADLVVFPEYLNVFPALSEDPDLVDAVAEMGMLAEELEAGGPEAEQALLELLGAVHRYTGHRSLESLFAARADDTSRWMDEAYGEAAERNGVHVLAGTYFAVEGGSVQTSLKNRAVVYDPEGERSYEQDKVFLTAFERNLLGLEAADVDDATGVEIGEWSVAVTICRDTYFNEWDTVYDDHDLWIDLRGEGTEYNAEVRERLEGTIPERISETDTPYGLTVFLTGEFHGLFWEGQTSFVEQSDEEVSTVSEAERTTAFDLISHTFKR